MCMLLYKSKLSFYYSGCFTNLGHYSTNAGSYFFSNDVVSFGFAIPCGLKGFLDHCAQTASNRFTAVPVRCRSQRNQCKANYILYVSGTNPVSYGTNPVCYGTNPVCCGTNAAYYVRNSVCHDTNLKTI